MQVPVHSIHNYVSFGEFANLCVQKKLHSYLVGTNENDVIMETAYVAIILLVACICVLIVIRVCLSVPKDAPRMYEFPSVASLNDNDSSSDDDSFTTEVHGLQQT